MHKSLQGISSYQASVFSDAVSFVKGEQSPSFGAMQDLIFWTQWTEGSHSEFTPLKRELIYIAITYNGPMWPISTTLMWV